MARINIEDSWWKDLRRFALAEKVGSLRMADALVVEAWYLSQSFWADGKKLVPYLLFKNIQDHELLFELNLAVKRDDVVYVRGAKKHHHWLLLRRVAGAKGGKSKANHAKQTGKQNESKPEANAKPLNSLLLSLNSKELNTIADSTNQRVTVLELDKIYQKYPRKDGKANGIKKALTQIKTKDDLSRLEKAVDNYVTKCVRDKTEKQFIKHFSTFMGCWTDYLDSDVGTINIQPDTHPLVAQMKQSGIINAK